MQDKTKLPFREGQEVLLRARFVKPAGEYNGHEAAQIEVESAYHPGVTVMVVGTRLLQATERATTEQEDDTTLRGRIEAALRLAVEGPGGFCTTTSADCDHESCEALAAVRAALNG